MAESLREQLIKAGLAKKQPARQKSRKPQSAKRHRPKRTERSGDQEITLAEAFSVRRRTERSEAARAQREKQEAARKKREIKEKLTSLVKKSALNDKSAEIGRNFPHGKKIKRIYVTSEQQAQINSGELGVIMVAGRYYLMTAEDVESARGIQPEAVVLLVNPHVQEEPGSDEDAAHKVPDDLMW